MYILNVEKTPSGDASTSYGRSRIPARNCGIRLEPGRDLRQHVVGVMAHMPNYMQSTCARRIRACDKIKLRAGSLAIRQELEANREMRESRRMGGGPKPKEPLPPLVSQHMSHLGEDEGGEVLNHHIIPTKEWKAEYGQEVRRSHRNRDKTSSRAVMCVYFTTVDLERKILLRPKCSKAARMSVDETRLLTT